jgi:hypothetical protein
MHRNHHCTGERLIRRHGFAGKIACVKSWSGFWSLGMWPDAALQSRTLGCRSAAKEPWVHRRITSRDANTSLGI